MRTCHTANSINRGEGQPSLLLRVCHAEVAVVGPAGVRVALWTDAQVAGIHQTVPLEVELPLEQSVHQVHFLLCQEAEHNACLRMCHVLYCTAVIWWPLGFSDSALGTPVSKYCTRGSIAQKNVVFVKVIMTV